MGDSNGVYAVFSGNICTGKDTVIDALRGNPVLTGAYGDVHFQREAVNHDQEILAAYHARRKDCGFYMELATLSLRAMLSSGIKERNGLVVGNRHAIEARQTFGALSMLDGIVSDAQMEIHDDLLRGAIEMGIIPVPDLVFFLYVSNVGILQERNIRRGDEGESGMNPEYLEHLQKMFEVYRTHFDSVYERLGLKIPKLVEIDTSFDVRTANGKGKLADVVGMCERELLALGSAQRS
jgi:deoxyadenosine/deoxycytidine kinase